jgi:5-formyltetrahydrofolate cyclo-ligase
MNELSRQQLRKIMRARRAALSNQQQIDAAQGLKQTLIAAPEIKTANSIALYLANDGEIDPAPFIHWCWQHNKQVFLPVIHPFSLGHLLFLRYTPTTKMIRNRFAIKEPVLDVGAVCPIDQLDVICTPLVAFDLKGDRLGMGGGFYDRTLAASQQLHKSSPRLIGLAHHCQLVAQLDVQDWDVAMSMIVTPDKVSEHIRMR